MTSGPTPVGVHPWCCVRLPDSLALLGRSPPQPRVNARLEPKKIVAALRCCRHPFTPTFRRYASRLGKRFVCAIYAARPPRASGWNYAEFLLPSGITECCFIKISGENLPKLKRLHICLRTRLIFAENGAPKLGKIAKILQIRKFYKFRSKHLPPRMRTRTTARKDAVREPTPYGAAAEAVPCFRGQGEPSRAAEDESVSSSGMLSSGRTGNFQTRLDPLLPEPLILYHKLHGVIKFTVPKLFQTGF